MFSWSYLKKILSNILLLTRTFTVRCIQSIFTCSFMSHTYWIRWKMYRPGWCFCRVMKTTGVLPGVRVCLKNAHGFWDNNITTPSVVTPQEHNQHHLLHIWFLVGNFFSSFYKPSARESWEKSWGNSVSNHFCFHTSPSQKVVMWSRLLLLLLLLRF